MEQIIDDIKHEEFKKIEEYYEIEKMTTQSLEVIIGRLIENQVQENNNKIAKAKHISYEYKIKIYNLTKEL